MVAFLYPSSEQEEEGTKMSAFYISGGKDMIDFEEELKKFKPSLEVEEAEDAIYNRDLTDLTDIMIEMLKEKNNK